MVISVSLARLLVDKDGKSPLLAFQGKPKISLSRVLGPMHSKDSSCYGIRLDGLVVIDCDEDDLDIIRDLPNAYAVEVWRAKQAGC